MKHLLLTTIAVTSLLTTTAFAGPIHDAARKGDIEAVKQHLAAGRNVNAKDDKGRTPLHRAAREGHKEVAELLIAAGAALNSKDKEGKTPFYHAARWGHTNIAALLIAAGADVNAKDDKGRTPLDRAVGYTEIVDLLRKHGGKTAEELKALMPRLEYGKDKLTINVPFDFRFIAKAGKGYTVEATGDLLKWNKVETIRGTGSEVKFTDTREAVFEMQYYRVKLVD